MSSVLTAAADGGLHDLQETLALSPGDINSQDEVTGETPLQKAVGRMGELEMVEFLLRSGADIDHQDRTGYTAEPF